MSMRFSMPRLHALVIKEFIQIYVTAPPSA